VSQPTCEGDTRPISHSLSKVLEDFVVQWMMADVVNNIDIQQFGCLRVSSTAYCLLDMINNWLFHLDSPDKHIRLLFLDYTQAFDRIRHNVLISKLIDIGVRRSLITWII
jgi:RNA-binding protein YlmH